MSGHSKSTRATGGAATTRLVVAQRAALSVSRGHPWVYREALGRHLPSQAAGLRTGSVVDLDDEAGAFLGRGLYDETSPIAVRVHERDPGRALDEAAILRRVESALALRDRLFPAAPDGAVGDTTAYRLLHGEGDRVPGLTLDRYGSVAVARVDGDAMAAWVPRLAQPLAAALKRRGIERLGLRAGGAEAQGSKLAALTGEAPPDRIVVRERGMAMEVDLARGQKTGAFLDQRDNRARVRALASGRARVLNLFSYAGGFSIAAALGGAGHVTSVDTAAGAHASAQRTFRLNGQDPGAHAFVTADVFAFLESARQRGDRWQLIVSDPPSFAPNERSAPRALAAYRRLHAAAAAVLAEGGLLCAASCSSHVGVDDFTSTLDDRTLGRDDLRVLSIHGQPADHPTLPAWPEGRYLKMVVLG